MSLQGFTKDITLPLDRWVGYIKDYEGGTIMQVRLLDHTCTSFHGHRLLWLTSDIFPYVASSLKCTMLHNVDYLNRRGILAQQKEVRLSIPFSFEFHNPENKIP